MKTKKNSKTPECNQSHSNYYDFSRIIFNYFKDYCTKQKKLIGDSYTTNHNKLHVMEEKVKLCS